jgi:hypothetical protein
LHFVMQVIDYIDIYEFTSLSWSYSLGRRH